MVRTFPVKTAAYKHLTAVKVHSKRNLTKQSLVRDVIKWLELTNNIGQKLKGLGKTQFVYYETMTEASKLMGNIFENSVSSLL